MKPPTQAERRRTRELNRRVKRAICELRAAGAKRIAVDIYPDGKMRVLEAPDDGADDEGARIGRLIEERMNAR